MSSNKKNNQGDNDVIVSSVIEKTKKSNNILISVLILIIIILSIVLVYFMFFKKGNESSLCSPITIKEVEVEPKHQFINFQGFKFRMPLDWDFVSKDNSYELSNKDESLFISLDSIDISYDEFISEVFQRTFLEELQTSFNIKIEKSSKKDKDKKEFYLMEGTNNSYNYMITVIGNDNKVILVKTQFINNVAFDKLKDLVIDFTISALKIS